MTRVSRSFVGVAGAVVLAGGVLAGAWFAPRAATGVPAVAVAGGGARVAVTTQPFDDPVHVTLLAVRTGGGEVRLNAAGTVTSSACAAGRSIASGSELARVDGQPVIALASRVPLWRNLAVGDSGEDVAALQTELRRLGASVPTAGRVDAATATAVRKFATDRGVSLGKVSYAVGSPVLPLGATAWLPAPAVTVKSCELVQGQRGDIGAPLLAVAPSVVRLVVTGAPATAVPGARVVTVDGARVAAPADGRITAQKDLDAVLATPEAQAWLAGEHVDEGLGATWTLTKPVTVATVPPASLIGLTTGKPCLVAPDGAHTPVTVVSSQLGRAFVTAVGGATLPTEVELDPTGSRTCS